MYCFINPPAIASERTICARPVSTPLYTTVLLPCRKAQFISVRETCPSGKRLPAHAAFAADIRGKAGRPGAAPSLRRSPGELGRGRPAGVALPGRPGRRPAGSPGRAGGRPAPKSRAGAPKHSGAGQRNTQKFRRNQPLRTQKQRPDPPRSPRLRANVRLSQIRSSLCPTATSRCSPPAGAHALSF